MTLKNVKNLHMFNSLDKSYKKEEKNDGNIIQKIGDLTLESHI